MPGVTITTATRTGPTSATVRQSSQAFFCGLAERGPTVSATLLTGIEDFELNYGGYQTYSYLHPTVQTFFEEGGTQCYVGRVVGPAATSGTLTVVSATPDDALKFDAVGAGAWSSGLTVLVAAGSAAGTINVTLALGGVNQFSTGDAASNAAVVGKFALSAVASRLVTVTDEGGAIAAAASATALSAGGDDRASVTSTHYTAGLLLFNDAYGTGAVSNPESAATAVYQGLIAHANTYNRVALLHSAAATSIANSIVTARTMATESHAEHAAYYFPWVYQPTSVEGVSRMIPPIGFAAAARARAHNQIGPHHPGAGIISIARYITAAEVEVDGTNGDLMDVDGANALRVINGTIRVYGARSLSNDSANFRYITAQDVVNSVVTQANSSLEDLVFAVIDGRSSLFAQISGRLQGILEPLRKSGALYEAFDSTGKRMDWGYSIVCNSGINPVTQLATGLVKAKIGMRVSSVGDRIEVDITKSNLTTSVV